jgi:autotransporter-associated beta strand protein
MMTRPAYTTNEPPSQIKKPRHSTIMKIHQIAACALVLTARQATFGTTLLWNSTSNPTGPVDGGGSWDTNILVTNWWNPATLTNQAWSNGVANAALIGVTNGAAGAITLATNIATVGLTFNTPGSGTYTLSGFKITNTGPLNFNSSVTLNTPLYNTGAINFGAPVTVSGTGAITNTGNMTINANSSSTINNPVFTTAVQTWSGSNDSLTLASTLTPSGSGNFVFSGSNAPYPFAPQFNIASFAGTGFTGGIYISNGATLNIHGGNWTNSGALVVRPTTIAQSAGGPNTINDNLTLNITGGFLYNTGAVTLGGSLSNSLGTNIINISGGTLFVAGSGSLIGQVNGQNYFIVSGTGTYIDTGTTYFCIGNIGTGPGSTGYSTYGGCVPVTTVSVTNNGTMVFSNTTSSLGVITTAGGGCEILMGREASQASPSGSPGNPNGSLICQSTLRFDGGTFKTGRAILPSAAGTTGSTNLVYFNGGLFEPILPCPNSNNMIQGLTHAYVSAGGAKINNNGISWGMSQPLETDPALAGLDGGLTVNGIGTLTLNGSPNTYTGPTSIGPGASLVVNGTLVGGGGISVLGGGTLGGATALSSALMVANGGSVSPSIPGGSFTATSLQFGVSQTDVTTNNFDVYDNPSSPFLSTTGVLTMNGTNVINVLGAAPNVGTYTLIQYGTEVSNAHSGFVVGSITYGTQGAYLQDTGSAIQLVVPTSVSETLNWTGTNTGAWDLTNSLDWVGATYGDATFFYSTATVAFNSATTNSNVNIVANVLPLSVTFSGADNYLLTGVGGIGNALGLNTPVTINGPGYATFGNANTYTGGTTISGGALVLTNGGSIQQGIASVGIQDNATLVFNRTDTSTFANWIAGAGQLVKQGSGSVTLSTTNNYTGGTIVSNGTLSLGVGASSGVNGTVSGTITIMTNATVLTPVQDSFGYGGNCVTALNIYGGTVLNTAGNYQDLWGNFGMSVSLYGGTLISSNASSSFNIGNTSTINTYPSASLSAIISTNTGGQLELRQTTTYFTIARGTAPVDFLINAPIVQISGVVGGIDVSGGGIMAVAGASSYGGGTTIESATTLQVGYNGLAGNLGAAAGAVNDSGTLVFALPSTNTIANAINGGGAVTEIGPGLTILSGASSWSGPTIVTSGGLAFSGAGQNSGNGTLEVQTNGTLVHLGSVASTYSALNLDSGSTDAFALPVTPDSIGGAVTVGGGNGPATILIESTGATNGVYDLISYSGGLNGLGLAGLNLVFANTRAGGTLITNAAGNMLQLNLTNTGTLDWNGNIGATPTWDLLESNQWLYAGSATDYVNGASVGFLDGAAKYLVTISTNVLPGSILVQASNTYTFAGAGSIGGSTALIQNGPGLLTIVNTNSYTGGTSINGGTLQLTNAGFISGPILDDSIFELSYTNTNGVMFTNFITGTGSLLNHGPGVVTVIATNTYAGGTTNSAGWLEFTNTMGASGEVVGAAPFGPNDIFLGDANTGANIAALLAFSVNNGSAGRYALANNLWALTSSTNVIIGATNTAALVYNSGVYYNGNITMATNITFLAQNAEVYVTTLNGTGNVTVAGNARVLLNTVADGGFTGNIYVTNSAGLQVYGTRIGANRNIDVGLGSSIILQGVLSVGNLTGAGNIVEYPSYTGAWVVSVGNGDGSFTFSGTFNPGTYAGIPGCISSSIALQKTGAGVFTFAGNGGYGQGTEVAEGTMIVNGVINSSGMLVDAGATLGGIGSMTDPVVVNGILSPGPGPAVSVGTLSTGAETWNGGGAYTVGLSNGTSVTGVDLLNITGALDIMSASTNVFTIDLVTLTSTNTLGLMANFNKALNYSWPIATASGGITNFNTNNFILNTSSFSNDFSSAGAFSLDVIGKSLVVNYINTALSAPAITGGAVSGGKFILSFTGPNTQDYTVLTSTNLALPLADWAVVATGSFGPGTSTYTNATPTAAAQFYVVESP